MNSVRSLRARFARASLVVCLSVSILFAQDAVALQQSGPPVRLPKLTATAQKAFVIPFSVNSAGSDTVQVVLQMSVDRGKTWRLHSQRAANDKGFPFSTSQDGEYWFAIQTINRNGTKAPLDHLLKPELRIAVDTVKPTFEFFVRPDAAGRVVGSWTATDANIDTCSMKIEYQNPGGQWIAVPTNSCRKAKHSVFRDELAWWPDSTTQSLNVRASIKDLAGNEVAVTRNMNLPTVASRKGQAGTVAQKPPLMTNYNRSRLPVALAHLYGDSADPNANGGNQKVASPKTAPRQARQLPLRQPPVTNPSSNSSQGQSGSPRPTTDPRTSQMDPPQPPRSSNRFASNSIAGQSSLPNQGRPPGTTGSNQIWDSQSPGGPTQSVQVQTASTYQSIPAASSVTESNPKMTADSGVSSNAPPGPTQWRRRSTPRVAQSLSTQQQENQSIAVGTTTRFPRHSVGSPNQPVQTMRPVTRSMPASSTDNPLGGLAPNAQWASSTTGVLPNGANPNGEMQPVPQPATALVSGPMMESLRQKACPSSARRFQMEYDINAIGPDGVKEVQLWMTRDGGNSWRKQSSDSDRRSPITAEVDGDGIFGFRILVVSNDGLRARPPKRGDPADMWVNIDTQIPAAKITGLPYGRGQDAGKLLVQWQASDANLSLRPVRLQYSSGPQGPWTTIEDGIRNEGQFAWKPAVDIPDQVYLRIQVRDIAGNVKTETLSRPVDISGLIPRGRIRGITPLNDGSPETNSAAGNST